MNPYSEFLWPRGQGPRNTGSRPQPLVTVEVKEKAELRLKEKKVMKSQRLEVYGPAVRGGQEVAEP